MTTRLCYNSANQKWRRRTHIASTASGLARRGENCDHSRVGIGAFGLSEGRESTSFADTSSRDFRHMAGNREDSRPCVGGEASVVRTRIPVWVLENCRRLRWSEARTSENCPTLRVVDLVSAGLG